MTDQSRPWDKRPDETDKAYKALTDYIDFGPDRSLEKIRQKNNKNTSYIRQLAKWSSAYNWVERASAYDVAQRAEVEQAQSEIRKKLLEDELSDGQLLLAKWRELLSKADLETERLETEKNGISKIYVEVNIPGYIGLAKLRHAIGDQMRRAIGLPEKITQSQHTGENGGPVELNGTQTLKVDDLDEVFRKMREYERGQRDEAKARRRAQSSDE
jgi:hypothetical protein